MKRFSIKHILLMLFVISTLLLSYGCAPAATQEAAATEAPAKQPRFPMPSQHPKRLKASLLHWQVQKMMDPGTKPHTLP